ncbi:MAG: hypothetical protein H6619_01780 [Deltaproteobacteria bacterium]|nr:hypothetical protein [Deltaproteobacteria bacterium]
MVKITQRSLLVFLLSQILGVTAVFADNPDINPIIEGPSVIDFSKLEKGPSGYEFAISGKNFLPPFKKISATQSAGMLLAYYINDKWHPHPFEYKSSSVITISTDVPFTATLPVIVVNIYEGKFYPSNLFNLAFIEDQSEDICSGYNSGSLNRPEGFPSYKSLLEDPVFFRRDLSKVDTITVCPAGCDYTLIKDAVKNAPAGGTIDVQAVSGSETKNVGIDWAHFPDDKPLHIYFTKPVTIGPMGFGGGWTFQIWNSSNIVVDGMNNLRIVGSSIGDTYMVSALLGIGPENFDAEAGGKKARSWRVIVKNTEMDGRFVDGSQGAEETKSGSKWGYRGGQTKDIAFCNNHVHNIAEEHAFYQGRNYGSVEFVRNTMSVVGRTCIQARNSGFNPEESLYILADNYCSDSSDASALTISDLSGTVIAHGNLVERSVGGFASEDSPKSEGSEPAQKDHSTGKIYLYNNVFNINEAPVQTTDAWEVPSGFVGPYREVINTNYSGVGVKGPSLFIENNYIFSVGKSGKAIYKNYCGDNPAKYVSLNNNLIGAKLDYMIAKGEFKGNCVQSSSSINATDWKNLYQNDLGSDFMFGQEAQSCSDELCFLE